jgi:hypothetical protein
MLPGPVTTAFAIAFTRLGARNSKRCPSVGDSPTLAVSKRYGLGEAVTAERFHLSQLLDQQ